MDAMARAFKLAAMATLGLVLSDGVHYNHNEWFGRGNPGAIVTESGTLKSAGFRPYFRRDQRDGVSPPDLSKICTFAEHIVHARGKRTQFTSVALDLTKIRDFGDTDYRLKREETERDGHEIVEHESLVAELQRVIRLQDKAERQRAVQAPRYARERREGLVKWKFDTSGVDRKNLITWAAGKVQIYFAKV
jgi:hypothetical protein